MAVRTKTRQRLRLLLIGILAIGILGTGAYLFRRRQLNARILRDRDAGYAALASLDYFTALNKIGSYVQRYPKDVDASLKYALARENVEEPNGKHILDAMRMYQWILQIDPENAQARERVESLYLMAGAGFTTETLSLTEKRNDPASLRARAITLSRLGRHAEAEQKAIQYNDLKPEDLSMQAFVCGEMISRGATNADVIARVTKLQQSHPNDPHFELLMGLALTDAGNNQEALNWTRQAIPKSMDDPELIQVVVQQLDRLRSFDESLALLQQAARAHGDVAFERNVIARLYQSGRFSDVIEQTSDLDQNLAKADVELLGYRALALIASNKPEESKRVIGVLADRKADLGAAAWVGVFRATSDDSELVDGGKTIKACREALKSRPNNAYFYMVLGDAYERIGEIGAAVGEWSAAERLAPVWPGPQARILKLMAVRGRSPELRSEADRVGALSSNDPSSLAVVAMARACDLEGPTSPELSGVLKTIDQVQRLQPGEPLSLSLEVSVLVNAGRLDEARGVIQTWLAPDKSPSAAAILGLARVSSNYHLGLEDQCVQRCGSLHGDSSQLAWMKADRTMAEGHKAEALMQFEVSRAAAPDRDGLIWKIDWARLLDQVGDPRASTEWAKLADANPDNPTIQTAVVSAPSTRNDLQLLRRAIDHLAVIIRDGGANWRLADARWNMQMAATRTNASEREKDLITAASILNDVTHSNPDFAPAQLLLGECMYRLDKKEAAVESLTRAAKLMPGSVDLALRLASLLQSMGDFQRAKPYVDQAQAILERQTTAAATNPPVDEPGAGPAQDNLRTLASLLAASGETARAVALLEKLDQDKQTPDLGLASLLQRQGKLTDDACQKLLASPTPAVISVVASYYADAGHKSEADSTLAMLDKVEAPPGDRELVRGLYLARYGDVKDAAEYLRKSTSAAPTNRQAWRALISVLFRSGDGAGAVVAAAEAQRSLPDDPIASRIVKEMDLVRSVADAHPAQAILGSLPDAPEQLDVAFSALEVIRDGRKLNKTVPQVAVELKPLADRAPLFWPLQSVMIDLELQSNNLDQAISIATRSMQLSPIDPAPAQRTAEALAAARRWDEVVAAAQEWKRRAGSQTVAADQLLASAYIATGHADTAASQLEPYLARASADPANWADLLTLYAEAMISQNRIAAAEKCFDGALTLSAGVRDRWRVLATQVVRDPKVSQQWLQKLAAAVPADAVDEHIRLALAWATFAKKSGAEYRPDARNSAAQAKELLSRSPDAKAAHWSVLGFAMETLDDAVGAEVCYRAAIKLDPRNALAQNNLAMILFRQGGDLTEAVALATRAAADDNEVARPDFLDTLAQISEKAGKIEIAEKSARQALSLRPKDPSMQYTLAHILFSAGKITESKQELQSLEQFLNEGHAADPELNKKLEEKLEALRKQLTGPTTIN